MTSLDDEPILSREYWNATPDELAEEIEAFSSEFGSFTPEWFVEVKFHLLKSHGLVKESRDEFCRVAITRGMCPDCDHLYVAKKCLLWYGLYRRVSWSIVRRAPPCVRIAYTRRNIKTVVNFLTSANLLDPPYYKSRGAPTCKSMERWGLCNPDEYCRAMKTGRTLEYIKAREEVKLSRAKKES
ncbi:hypothetical protein EU538_03515 [Candidatus Thorarchaeota archaeon]|nr:MAG: hypothetical protein EU538_03515 [Candidatus Thorarchaeota archaeon]